ncbi:YlxR family protein [Pseudoclavibacter sp. RFBB5]|uniref:YlxR family protein n=1 Tax=Pseudoclavibacter sp. RFBB5 TaxID=2080574 RepID=UPI0028006FBF|nr:YlxR family protein [Pseudoclavibacter sp. RFBB5]
MRVSRPSSRGRESTSSPTRSSKTETKRAQRGSMSSVRTCVGCRSRSARSQLLRVVLRQGSLEVDISASLPGRGAWIHPTAECTRLAIERRAFLRAFKTGTVDTEALSRHASTLEQGERTAPTTRKG